MKRVIDIGLPDVGRPLEWVILADGILYATLLPVYPDGSFETGDIKKQTEITLNHLRSAVEAAGGSLDDVVQVLVYMPYAEDFAGMNEVYARYFSKPYPQRATLLSKLVIPGARIEIVAYAHINVAERN
ncbi:MULTISPECIES: RidA family protein [unclassified Mesorhizobium]|uniref:RidA family protein n=1 Tax=unclassified Mesorhizobium TaxID=325217 RepID=UPI000BAF38B5|nr:MULTISPECIES: RidA family protein [unclassified Mesorhizobium]TGT60784.1 RidA family protein [Mesorhizobium sp. M00.F.Ca.ET.170.01.1.1]AZO10116.1 RidA family protein [Mesorhizobium sp. M3A.F.Ca.ET.080.04.2.1]RWB75803.1 MAG: RidA family protein [Mesorhizobium sp.]RWB91554.1 MAG: RidA family protein [Mesorhizobium sp.]RWE23606.1 MAG: RidA family protein [Mesorhizobium sp.]